MSNEQEKAARARIFKYRRFNILSLDFSGAAEDVITNLSGYRNFFRNTDLIVATGDATRQACVLAADQDVDSLDFKDLCIEDLPKKLLVVCQDAKSFFIAPGDETLHDAVYYSYERQSLKGVIFNNACLVGAAHAITNGALLEQIRILSVGTDQIGDPSLIDFQASNLFKARYHRVTAKDDFNTTSKWLDEYWK